jgi:hypothetical protein
MAGTNEHPSAHSEAVFMQNKNTKGTLKPNLLKPLEGATTSDNVDDNMEHQVATPCLSHAMFDNLVDTAEEANEEESFNPYTFVEPEYPEINISDAENKDLDNFKKFEFMEKTNFEALKCIAGYVAHRFRGKYPHLGIATKKLQVNPAAQDWISSLSSGGLIYSCDELIRVATVMDETFSEMHGSSLSHEKFIFNKLVNNTMLKLETTTIPHEVIFV